MKPCSIVLFAGVAFTLACPAAPASQAATESVLYSFCSQQNCSDGLYPIAGLIDVNGTLYGTTLYGGVGHGAQGTVFSFDALTRTEAVVHSFVSSDGANLFGRLLNVKGTLFGTTEGGGRFGCPDQFGSCGTVFSLDPATGTETWLHYFKKAPHGFWPFAGLINLNGTLYGATAGGGTYNFGTLFSINRSTGKVAILHSFGNIKDGFSPTGGLLSVNGELYGMTVAGGARYGTVFSFDPATGTEKIVHSFRSDPDGATPQYGDLIAVNGSLYGTTSVGGAYGYGTVFSLDPSTGVETVLHSFNKNGKEGYSPWAGLLKVKGTLYGTTQSGGTGTCSFDGNAGCGTVFSVELGSGSETVVYSFQNNGTDGSLPESDLLNVNGVLYGTTELGGAYGGGTIFTVTP